MHTRKLQLERGGRLWERNNPTDTQVRDAGGGGGAEIPLQFVVHGEAAHGCAPLQPREIHSGTGQECEESSVCGGRSVRDLVD